MLIRRSLVAKRGGRREEGGGASGRTRSRAFSTFPRRFIGNMTGYLKLTAGLRGAARLRRLAEVY